MVKEVLEQKLTSKAYQGLSSHKALEHLFEKMIIRSESMEDSTVGMGVDTMHMLTPQPSSVPVVPLEQPAPSVRRFHAFRRSWLRYGAAAVLIIGAASYFWFRPSLLKQNTIIHTVSAKEVIAPGGNKAVLTLADGSTIILDSAADGRLAEQGNTKIEKLKNGQIIYIPFDSKDQPVLFNTMTTPRGGQYQLTLPDGTGVWLNAASSITYPTAFAGSERKVEITGEVYMEVKKNISQPFRVQVNDITVEVIGTHFNINSYNDESLVKTTLIEGSVKVSYGNVSELLQPGQQAQIANTGNAMNAGVHSQKERQILIQKNADTRQVMAWKNGQFNFDGADLHTVMRQLERWYDIQVRYQGNVSTDVFRGQLTRDLNLSDMLEILGKMEIKFKLEGRILTVTQ